MSHITVGCNADVVNMAGEKYTSFLNVPEIVGRSTSVFSQYKFPTTSYDNICLNDAGLVRNVLRQVPVSTGLKLAYGEEEPNTSISSAGECVMHSSTMCHNDNLLVEFARQSDEYDHFIRIQVHFLYLRYANTACLILFDVLFIQSCWNAVVETEIFKAYHMMIWRAR